MIQMIASSPKTNVERIERDTYIEYYLTITSTDTGSLRDQALNLYQPAIDIVRSNRIQVIQEKVHGDADCYEAFLDTRFEALAGGPWFSNQPFTFVEGRPLDGQTIVSLQLWGISPKNEASGVSLDSENDQIQALVWDNQDFELVYCPQVHGYYDCEEANKPVVTVQCQTMFERCSQALRRFGLDFTHVARTWIYARRLLDWYGEFNRIRTSHFHETGLYNTETEPVFPASTGIQGRFGDEECFLDLLALKIKNPENVAIRPITTTSRQKQAFGYGSAFSRGMVIDHEGYRTVYVSGTASINEKGESTYIGNAEIQTIDTLMNIGALLEDQGGSLSDVKSGVVYCKTAETYEAYKRSLRLLRIPEMPLVCVEADVCRHELLIEIELVAVIESDPTKSRWQRG